MNRKGFSRAFLFVCPAIILVVLGFIAFMFFAPPQKGVALGDVNADGKVDCEDLQIVQSLLGKDPHPNYPFAHLGGIGVVDQQDVQNVINHLPKGTQCPNMGAIDTSSWLAYHNTKYGFSFKYPANFQIESDDQPASSPDEGSDITVSKPNLEHRQFPQWLEVVVHAQLTKDDSYQLPSTLWDGPINVLVQSIWKLAKSEGTADGQVATTTVAGETAYMLTVTDGIGVNGLGYAIDTENQWIFLKRDSSVFEISLPNTQEFISILNTFQFDKP